MDHRRAEMLSDTLRRLRKRQRMSQPELASAAGISRTTITNLERGIDLMTGRPPNPSTETLRCLARGLATDGEGGHHPPLEARFYAELMDAAGYLPPRGAILRERLQGRIPQDQLDALIQEKGDASPETQHSVANDALAQTTELIEESRPNHRAS